MRWFALVTVSFLIALTGCATVLPTTGSVSPTGSGTPGTASPWSAEPSMASPSPTPSPTKKALPDAEGALDVSGYESAHFASPTGAIWCAMSDAYTLCHFPRGMKMTKVPKPSKVCPGAGLDVTGVSVEVRADYFCSGGTESLPMTNGLYVDWWRTTGFPSVKYDGFRMATLPYGEKLVYGRFVCLSEKSGVTCVNTDTKAGFKVAKAGVTIYRR